MDEKNLNEIKKRLDNAISKNWFGIHSYDLTTCCGDDCIYLYAVDRFWVNNVLSEFITSKGFTLTEVSLIKKGIKEGLLLFHYRTGNWRTSDWS